VSRFARLRRYFFVGLIVMAPAGITVFVLSWIFSGLDAIFGRPLQAALGVHIPGLGFLLLALVIVAVGWIVHQAIGRRILGAWNRALVRFPVTGRIYNAASQIAQTLFTHKRRIFKRCVLVPYPTDGLWAVAFVTNEEAPVMSRAVGEKCVNVFVPTTPNPTSGFLLVVPESRMRAVNVTVEDAMKLVISAGAVSPLTESSGPVVRRGLDIETLFRDPTE